MKNKKTDYFDMEPTFKNTFGVWLLLLLIEGGIALIIVIIYTLYKIFT